MTQRLFQTFVCTRGLWMLTLIEGKLAHPVPRVPSPASTSYSADPTMSVLCSTLVGLVSRHTHSTNILYKQGSKIYVASTFCRYCDSSKVNGISYLLNPLCSKLNDVVTLNFLENICRPFGRFAVTCLYILDIFSIRDQIFYYE